MTDRQGVMKAMRQTIPGDDRAFGVGWGGTGTGTGWAGLEELHLFYYTVACIYLSFMALCLPCAPLSLVCAYVYVMHYLCVWHDM